MAQPTPARLADEIRTDGGRWSLTFARFRPSSTPQPRAFYVSIGLSGGGIWTDVSLDSRPSRDARGAAEVLERSGYEILSVRSKPFHARRPLRGLRELNAEVRRLEALSRDSAALRSFPTRAPRTPGLPAGPARFSTVAFDRLRHEHGWTLECVSAGRKGSAPFANAPKWRAGAWCWILDVEDKRRLELYVQLFEPHRNASPDPKELARLTRAVSDRLEPLGYAPLKVRGPKRPPIAMFEKAVRGLAVARRERGRLDKVLFGD